MLVASKLRDPGMSLKKYCFDNEIITQFTLLDTLKDPFLKKEQRYFVCKQVCDKIQNKIVYL